MAGRGEEGDKWKERLNRKQSFLLINMQKQGLCFASSFIFTGHICNGSVIQKNLCNSFLFHLHLVHVGLLCNRTKFQEPRRLQVQNPEGKSCGVTAWGSGSLGRTGLSPRSLCTPARSLRTACDETNC